MKDQTKRILPVDRLSDIFITGCCPLLITWDTDYSLWNQTDEVWGSTYYTIISYLKYIGV